MPRLCELHREAPSKKPEIASYSIPTIEARVYRHVEEEEERGRLGTRQGL